VAAIGFGAANLAVQVSKERAVFEAVAGSQKVGQLAYPPLSSRTWLSDGDATQSTKLNL
jgi:hypothetical protein